MFKKYSISVSLKRKSIHNIHRQ